MTTGIWVIGMAMTRFGRYPELDDVDFAFEAASGALDDAGVGMADVDILAAGRGAALRQPVILERANGQAVTITGSIGIASGISMGVADLLRNADHALYRAKAEGKNRYFINESEMPASAQLA